MNPKGRKKPKLKIRIPIPKPTRFHSTPKGEKGYDRKRVKREDIDLKRIRKPMATHQKPSPLHLRKPAPSSAEAGIEGRGSKEGYE